MNIFIKSTKLGKNSLSAYVGNFTQIQYTLDLTRQYHNLLERTEEERAQTYFWDGNVASYEENGETNYYLQDELGSPLPVRVTDMEPLEKTCMEIKGTCSHLDIRDTKEIR